MDALRSSAPADGPPEPICTPPCREAAPRAPAPQPWSWSVRLPSPAAAQQRQPYAEDACGVTAAARRTAAPKPPRLAGSKRPRPVAPSPADTPGIAAAAPAQPARARSPRSAQPARRPAAAPGLLLPGPLAPPPPPSPLPRPPHPLPPLPPLAALQAGPAHRALLVRRPWIDLLLSGAKTWELRGRATHVRGRVALAASGSGALLGGATLVACHGPLLPHQLAQAEPRHRVPAAEMGGGGGCGGGGGGGATRGGVGPGGHYKACFAWEFAGASHLASPVGYDHPQGAVVWVRLPQPVHC